MPPKKASKLKKKNGKKGKKGKQIIRLGPNGEPIYTPEQRHQIFVDRLNAWLRANCGQLIDKFHKYDAKGCGLVNKEEFSEGLVALKAPLSDEERELVVKFLNNKPPRNKVDYLSFARGIKIPFPTEDDGPAQEVLLSVRNITNPACPRCKLKFPPTERLEIRPRFISLTLELVQFIDKELPCNFTTLITASLSIYGAKQLIQDKFGHSLINLEVFQDKGGEGLPNMWTMSSIGYQGGTEKEPQEVTLYYDVNPAFYSCPLLLTDHYFAKHETKVPETTEIY